VFQQYHSKKNLSEFYPQDGGESQLALKLRHCHPMYIHLRQAQVRPHKSALTDLSWDGDPGPAQVVPWAHRVHIPNGISIGSAVLQSSPMCPTHRYTGIRSMEQRQQYQQHVSQSRRLGPVLPLGESLWLAVADDKQARRHSSTKPWKSLTIGQHLVMLQEVEWTFLSS